MCASEGQRTLMVPRLLAASSTLEFFFQHTDETKLAVSSASSVSAVRSFVNLWQITGFESDL